MVHLTHILPYPLLNLPIRLLDTAHTAATIHAVYYYMVKNFGNVTAAYHIVWSIQVRAPVSHRPVAAFSRSPSPSSLR